METRSIDNDYNRKRKNMEEEEEEEEEEEDHYLDLDLSLSLGLRSLSFQEQENNKPPPKKIKTDTILPLYEWAKDRRCKIHSLKSLLQTNGSSSSSSSTIIIKGSVNCNNCKLTIIKPYDDLLRQFRHVVQFVLFRANGFIPWSNKKNSVYYSRCDFCLKQDSCRPMMPNKKRNIDWLFLLLSKSIECCIDSQLRYYCKHNNIRFDKGSAATASRDRLIQATYWSLCYQLDSDGVIFQSTNLPFSYE